MSDIVGQAQITVDPDVSAFADNLMAALQPTLDQASSQLSDTLGQSGQRGGDAMAAGIGAGATEAADRLNDLRDSASGALNSVGDKAGETGGILAGMADAILAPEVAIPAAFLAIGVGLEELGSHFQETFNQMRISTGATGPALDALKGQFNDIYGTVPASMDAVQNAIVKVTGVLGDQGDQAKEIAKQMLEYAKISGGDAVESTNKLVGVFALYHTSVEDQAIEMDRLLRVSQETKVPLNELTDQVASYAPKFQAFGFSIDEVSSIIGTLKEHGTDVAPVMMGLNKYVADLEKHGQDGRTGLKQMFDEIANSPNKIKVGEDAIKAFGARGGPLLVKQIEEGNFSYEKLLGTISSGGDTVHQAEQATQTWQEKLGMFVNTLSKDLEPVATSVFNGLGLAVDYVSKAWADISSAFDTGGFQAVTDKVVAIFSDLGQKIGPVLGDLWNAIIGWIGDHWQDIVAAYVKWEEAMWKWVAEAIPPLLTKLGELLSKVGAWIRDDGWPALVQHLGEWTNAFVKWVEDSWPGWVVKAQELLNKIGVWARDTALPAIVKQVEEWRNAMIAWVIEAAKELPGKLAEWLGGLIDWSLNKALPVIEKQGHDMLVAFRDWIIQSIKNLPNDLAEWLGVFRDWVIGLPDKIKNMFVGAVEWLNGVGKDIADGLLRGAKDFFTNEVPKFVSWVKDTIGNNLKAVFGISSPAAAMMPIGAALAQGIGAGFQQSWSGAVGQGIIDLTTNKLVPFTEKFTTDLGKSAMGIGGWQPGSGHLPGTDGAGAIIDNSPAAQAARRNFNMQGDIHVHIQAPPGTTDVQARAWGQAAGAAAAAEIHSIVRTA